jgi:hypothetical protein
LSQHQWFIEELQSTLDSNVFVMIRYRDTKPFRELEGSIRDALREYGLRARLAKDRALSDDLWENVRIYMNGSQYGIAVFDEIHEREFNPNIALELGYMYALGRRCLLLKDKQMPRLPTDTLGKIYKDFDPHEVASTVPSQVRSWCEDDLGLVPSGADADASDDEQVGAVLYDSTVDESYSGWGMYDTTYKFTQHIRLIEVEDKGDRPGQTRAFELRADGTEYVGVNKKVETLRGLLAVDYCAVSSGAASLNLYLCVIPMTGSLDTLVEVGAERVDDPANRYSPYRVRMFVPHHEIGDGGWHKGRLAFDFRKTPGATYVICAARVNEGCPNPGPGVLRFRNVRVWGNPTGDSADLID